MAKKGKKSTPKNKGDAIRKINPLMEHEAKYFQELVDCNNRYQAVLKQRTQYNFAITKMEEDRTKVQKGELKGPFSLTVIPKVLTRQVEDKKEILDLFDKQLQTYKKMVKALNGQVEHRYEEYVESGLRTAEFLQKRFKGVKAKQIMPDRKTAKEDEETLFEAEFEKLLKDPKTQEEFKKKSKEAAKKNVARKTKKA